MKFKVKEISKDESYRLICSTHYSKQMPSLTKHFLGIYEDSALVGTITLGWGTQPRQTIRKLFEEAETRDYYEIGKMCMLDSMPKNSESQMLRATIKWMQNNVPDKMYLYT